jgi:hypothetical protein
MTEEMNGSANSNTTQTKAQNVNEKRLPEWIRNAPRIDRPEIHHWYKVEEGAIDGMLIWRGRQEHHQSGDTYNVYAIRETSTGRIIGLSELVGLRDLRMVKVGSKVFINPIGKKQTDSGRSFEQFEIFADQQEALPEPTKGTGKKGSPGSAGPSGAAALPSEDVPF